MKYTQGELKVKKYLQRKHIKYKPQYKLIINNRIHIFDFALIDRKGVKAFIEYDGEQHYKPISIFGGEKGFKERQERDREKNIFCSQNNICLIRISYYKNDINSFLNKELKDINKLSSIPIQEYNKKLPFEKRGFFDTIKDIINK